MQNEIIKNRTKIKEKKKFPKIIFWILILILIGGGIYFFKKKNGGKMFEKINVFSNSGDIQISFFLSKGVRDTAKKEQTTFAVNDPIQVKIDFDKMNDGEKAIISVKKDEKVLQTTEIPLSKEKGSRFVNLSQDVRKETGKYIVEVSKKVNESIKVLKTGEFEIK